MTSSGELYLAIQEEQYHQERRQEQQERINRFLYLENYNVNGTQIQNTAQQIQDRQKGR